MLNNITKNDLPIVDYPVEDKIRCDELEKKHDRIFAPPKLRPTKLNYLLS